MEREKIIHQLERKKGTERDRKFLKQETKSRWCKEGSEVFHGPSAVAPAKRKKRKKELKKEKNNERKKKKRIIGRVRERKKERNNEDFLYFSCVFQKNDLILSLNDG